MIYESNNIKIVPLTKEILNSNYKDWLNDPEITQYNSHGRFAYMEKDIDDFLEQANDGNNITWAILFKNAEQYSPKKTYSTVHIGNVALQEIDYIHRSAELAILIGNKNYWGKGVGSTACLLVKKHAFERLNIHRLWLGTVELNKGMIAIAKKIGMEIEGRLINQFWHKDKYIDILRFSIVKDK